MTTSWSYMQSLSQIFFRLATLWMALYKKFTESANYGQPGLEYIEFYSANFSDFSFSWYNNLVQMVQDWWTTEYIHDLQKYSD